MIWFGLPLLAACLAALVAPGVASLRDAPQGFNLRPRLPAQTSALLRAEEGPTQ